MMRWGLVPSWAKDLKIGNRLINARCETVAEKPSFRAAFKRRRCLVVADGFYEWKSEGKQKQPYLIHREDNQPFAFAGLWEERKGMESFTIITTEANELMRPLHDRMPVILEPQDYDLWMDTAVQEADEVQPLLCPYLGEDLEVIPVNPIVNNVRNDVPECVERVG